MVKATGMRKNILESLRLYKNLPTASAKTVEAVSRLEEPIRRTRASSLERQRKYTEVPATGGGSAAASRPPVTPVHPNTRVGHTKPDSWTPIEKGRGGGGGGTPRGGNTTRGRGRGGATPRGGRPPTGGKKTRKLNRQK